MIEKNEFKIGSKWEIEPSDGYAGIDKGIVALLGLFGRRDSLALFPTFDLEQYDIPSEGYIPTEYAVYKYVFDDQINVVPLDVFNDHTTKFDSKVGGDK